MSMRKKRMIITVAGVILCGIAVWLIIQHVQRRDAEEFAKKCRSYVGVWTSDDGRYEMTVRRVTGAHVILSLQSKDDEGAVLAALDSVTAHAVGEERYEFTYGLEQDIYAGTNTTSPEGKEKGSIWLLDSSIRLEMPNVRENYKALDFQGVFKRKKVWTEDRIRLLDNMGTANEVPESLKDYCVFEKGSDGRVERIRMLWEKTGEKLFYCDINGINKLCFAGDCTARFGRADGEEELSAERRRLVFHDDSYRYAFIVNPDGLVVEGDCQYREIPGMVREGDFLIQGDTLIRYLGDYENERELVLPEGIKRIATHAFTEEILNDKYVCPFKLTIPNDVTVEAEAFANCSKMELFFEEGRTEIPERAFANMVQVKKPYVPEERPWVSKGSWVTVTLPKSMKRLGRASFQLDSIKAEDMVIRDPIYGEKTIKYPVTVWLNRGLEIIEEDALSGIILREYLPDSLRKAGRGITVIASEARDVFELPKKLEELGDGALTILDDDIIEKVVLPDSLRVLGENFLGRTEENISDNHISVGKKNPYFKRNKRGWLTSKDETVLYRVLTLASGYLEIAKYIKLKEDYESSPSRVSARIELPEGLLEIRSDALSDIASLLRNYAMSEEYYDYEMEEPPTVKITFVYPKSLKRISRYALFTAGGKQKFAGDIPELGGTLDEETTFSPKEIYVKKGQRKEFLQRLFAGQESLTEQMKEKIRSRVKTY